MKINSSLTTLMRRSTANISPALSLQTLKETLWILAKLNYTFRILFFITAMFIFFWRKLLYNIIFKPQLKITFSLCIYVWEIKFVLLEKPRLHNAKAFEKMFADGITQNRNTFIPLKESSANFPLDAKINLKCVYTNSKTCRAISNIQIGESAVRYSIFLTCRVKFLNYLRLFIIFLMCVELILSNHTIHKRIYYAYVYSKILVKSSVLVHILEFT